MEKTKKTYVYKVMKSPLGDLTLVATDKGLAAILWKDEKVKDKAGYSVYKIDKKHLVLVKVETQLNEYFAGKRKKFAVPLDFSNADGTEFQKKVWKDLLDIPFGRTISYGDIARHIGHPKAVRAVGAAAGRNPICIIAPCHRVIGSSGKLTGYAGGMGIKVHLLRLEGATISGKPSWDSRVLHQKDRK